MSLQPSSRLQNKQHAMALLEAQRAAEAKALLQQLCHKQERDHEAWLLLGTANVMLGLSDQAEQCYRQALALSPDDHEAHFGLANVLLNMGRHQESVGYYQQALRRQPAHAEAYNNQGVALNTLGQYDAAVASYRQALDLRPDYMLAWNNLGNSLAALKRWPEAEQAFNRALALKPDFAAAHYNLANTLVEQQRWADADAAYRRAIKYRPDYAVAYNNLGKVLSELGRYDNAIACFQEALRLKPDNAETYGNMGNIYLDKTLLTQAIECFKKAIALKPDFSEALNNLGRTYKVMGQMGEAIEYYRRSLTVRPENHGVHSNLLLALNYHPAYTRAQIYEEHRRWDELHARRLRPDEPSRTDPDPERRLRIGYVSPDFRAHLVARFLEPVLAAHDRDRFELFGYANVKQPDATTDRLRGLFDGWRDILKLSDADTAALIRDDRIDILVDLTGHTADNRLLVFARKPAPLQVTCLGYPNTTGMSAMDYRIVTRYTDPPGETERYHSERLLRMDSHFCYRPLEDAPPVNRLPALDRGHVTFASFNNFAKITPAVIALWAKVLTAVPGSRLMLKAKGLSDAATQVYAREAFAAHGIIAEHLDLRGWGTVSEYLECFQHADISLDPFPFNGGTTTRDSLWMGLPIITLVGETYMGRVGLSILSSLGLENLAARSEAEYIANAVQLAGDLDRLQELRAGMRDRMSASITNGPRFTRGLEQALRIAWREWCANA